MTYSIEGRGRKWQRHGGVRSDELKGGENIQAGEEEKARGLLSEKGWRGKAVEVGSI